MKIIKLYTGFVAGLSVFGYSSFAFAEEFEQAPTFNYVPLIVFLVLLVVFRKKLIAEATPHPCEEEHHETHAPEQPAKTAQAETVQTRTAQVETATAEPEQEGPIDMSKNVEQCQGATTKGTRCKRTSNLETIEVMVDGKRYRFKTCRQHHSDAFKPFLS